MGGPLEKDKDPHAEDIFKIGGGRGLGQGLRPTSGGDIVKMGGLEQGGYIKHEVDYKKQETEINSKNLIYFHYKK
jgi:hypothetical protein